MSRRPLAVRWILVAAAAALAFAPPALAEPAKVGYPNSIAATGDSITRAFNTCYLPFIDCPRNSWSTGWSPVVNSHYVRILAANPLIYGKNYNDAASGAKMAKLNQQVALAAAQKAEYVTILMGANDVCTSSEANMTPVSDFRAQFEAAMQTLSVQLPDARIYVVSIPNVYRLWYVLKDNWRARTAWKLFRICQSMLANPLSTAPADVERRDRVLQREIDFNTQLAEVCALYVHCRFDANTVFNTPFSARDVSTRDYFHPSLAGQARLASVSWDAGYDFGDSIPPLSTAVTAPVDGGTEVTITASDDVAIAGIEYQLESSSYQRYVGPVTVATGTTIIYRAVDVNGNIEASLTLTG